jgi:hypothetical protein
MVYIFHAKINKNTHFFTGFMNNVFTFIRIEPRLRRVLFGLWSKILFLGWFFGGRVPCCVLRGSVWLQEDFVFLGACPCPPGSVRHCMAHPPALQAASGHRGAGLRFISRLGGSTVDPLFVLNPFHRPPKACRRRCGVLIRGRFAGYSY